MQELSERDQKKYASMEEMPRAASNGKPRFGIALRAEAIRPRSSPSTLAFERLHSAVVCTYSIPCRSPCTTYLKVPAFRLDLALQGS
ncbi:hypothetical protein KC337_g79 [Hortaea werneckii]|nr:hypothetical protein KC337_g79 [Hortaea werneckii]